jgi:hypothetical protein
MNNSAKYAHAKPKPCPWAFDPMGAWDAPAVEWDMPAVEWDEPQHLTAWDEEQPE